MWEMVLLPIIAFFIGILAAMAGIGGGVFIVPTLILLSGLEPAYASGTSIAVIVFTSLSSTIRYSRQKRIDYLLGFALALTTIPGAFIGSYLTALLNKQILGLTFAFFLIFVALRMLIGKEGSKKRRKNKRGKIRRLIDNYGRVFTYSVNFRLIPFLGFVTGFSSGLLGIGGGSMLVPILHLAVGVPIHITVATSMLTMIFTSISGMLTHLWLQHINFEYVIFLVPGIVFGAQLGAHYAMKVSAKNLRRIFGIILLIVSIRMILKFTFLIP
jgi:hypothetical protein